jgi:pilus assembly protein CpaE
MNFDAKQGKSLMEEDESATPSILAVPHAAHGQRVLVLLRPDTDSVPILAALKPLYNMDIQTFRRPKVLTSTALTDGKAPNILVLDADPSDETDLKLIQELKTGPCARIPVVVLAERGADLAAIKAIRAGADDVVLRPIDADEAREVFTRLATTSVAESPSNLGKVIAFMHLAGGAGATTLAVNSAVLLAGKTNLDDTCLLDLDIQFGNAANLLDLPSRSPIQEILADPSRLDRQMLESMMVKHESGIRVLSAPAVPLPLTAFQIKTVSTLIQIARLRFKYVIVDLPVALVPWSDAVFEVASAIYVICPPTVAAIHRFSHLTRLLQREEMTNLPIQIVLNRFASNRFGDISVAQFEKSIGRDVRHKIPNDYALISASQNQGKAAVVMEPKSKFTVALADMLRSDLGTESARGVPKRRSFLGIGY